MPDKARDRIPGVLAPLVLGMTLLGRRQLALALREISLSVGEMARVRRNLRLRFPCLFWRYATFWTIICVLGSDPHLDFWSLQAECVYPPNFSTETIRYTTYGYDFAGHLTQVNCPEGVLNYEYDLATGRHTGTC